MNKIILIEKTILYTRVAVIINHELIATYMESNLDPDAQNKIVVGQVDKIVKNLNAAFVDYGAEKKGLLHLSQVPDEYKQRFHEGTRLPVQIVKQNEGEKGHRLTSKLSIRGKYLICTPFDTGISVSKKIKSQKVRQKLKDFLKAVSKEDWGFIVRTHAEHADLTAIEEDVKALIKQVNQMMQVKDHLSKGTVLYKEMPMYLQIAAENIRSEMPCEIICDDGEVLHELTDLCQNFEAGYEKVKLTYFDQNEDLFHIYDIEKEMDALHKRRIWLKNGGNIIIDYTEALTAIDVNSAKAILTRNRRKAVLELNKLAVKESILQVFRRNLSGMIILDLVEMPHAEDREEVYLYAKRLTAMFEDNRITLLPITELGLLQIARTKKYTSIPSNILDECKMCGYFFGKLGGSYEAYLIEKKVKMRVLKTTNRELTIEASTELIQFFDSYDLLSKIKSKYGVSLKLSKI